MAQNHEILDIMHRLVLPALEKRTSHLIPLVPAEVESDTGFQSVFPYGTDSHDCFEWMWVDKNWTHVKIRNSIYRMNPGDFCLIAPGVPHAEVYLPSTLPHQSLWFSYRAGSSTLRYLLFDYDSVGHGKVVQWSSMPVNSLLGPLLVTLQSEIEHRQSHADSICLGLQLLLASFSIRAIENMSALPNGDDLNHVSRQIIEYLHLNYTKDVSLEDIGRAVHLSRNYVATVFKRETGKTVGQTLTEIRLQYAKLMLVEQRRTVRDVASAVGFRSPEHFCRVFQRYEKVSPSSYSR